MKKLKEGERDSLSFVYLLSDRAVGEALIMYIVEEDATVCTVDEEKSRLSYFKLFCYRYPVVKSFVV